MHTKDLKASGDATMVHVQMEGHWRWVCVTRGAIEDQLLLGPDQAAQMTSDERCDWVREHLADVFAATRKKLINPQAVGNIVLIATDL